MKKYKSKCCNAEVVSIGIPDFLVTIWVCTVHFECTKCGESCDCIESI